MELENIIEIVKERLSEKRFNHCVCVMKRAEEIATKYGYDIEKAKKVGISHDIAKELSSEYKLKYVEENNIEIDDMEKENTTLLHAKIGAHMTKNLFGFSKEMTDAILAHTTGLPNMDMLSKILFIADRTSSERNFPDISYLNSLLDKNIDEAVLYILDKKIQLQLEKRQTMHVNTVITRNELLKNNI